MSVIEREQRDEAARAAPYPIPAGRGRWNMTLHRRVWALTQSDTTIGELRHARNRKLVQAWNQPAVLTFDIDGNAEDAKALQELATDVMAWRWDETTGQDVPMFHGIVGGTVDSLDEQSHTVSVTCTDYLGMLARRMFNQPAQLTLGPYDQDSAVFALLSYANDAFAATGAGTKFGAAAWLPLDTAFVNPDGSSRGNSGQQRTLQVQGGSIIGELLDNLAHLQGGFDYDCAASGDPGVLDQLRVFYPAQGVTRTNPVLHYPGTIASLTRTITSADYANYWRTIGNNQTTDATAAQTYGEATVAEAFNLNVGVWMQGDQDSDQYALNFLGQIAAGRLNVAGLLVPSYAITLRPGWWYRDAVKMGDTVPLVVQSGRLNVQTTQRVLGISYEPTDDGEEKVTLTVGRAPTTLIDVLGAQAADVRALARR
jgi:hypothetical protein